MTSYEKKMAEAKAEFEALMLGEWKRKNRKAEMEETQEMVEGWWDILTSEAQ